MLNGRAVLAMTGAIALGLGAAQSPATGATSPAKPRDGKYAGRTGEGRKLTLVIDGGGVQYVAFRVTCGKGAGATSLQSISLVRSATGYRFKLDAHALVGYSDNRPDENGAVLAEGRFSPSARTATGRVRVRAPHCRTGYVAWRASR
jgi:hypothetical protein